MDADERDDWIDAQATEEQELAAEDWACQWRELSPWEKVVPLIFCVA